MSKKLLVAFTVLAALILGARLAFPAALNAMGLHPRYTGERYQLPGGQALIVTTSHAELGDPSQKTGVFASEMTAPYYAFLDGHMIVDLASIAGGEVPIDPISFRWFVEAPSDKRFRDDPTFLNKVAHSLKVDDVDFRRYDIVFLAGGWGAAYDLGFSDVLGRKITEAWRAGKVVGGICHGPLGLLRATDETGQSLVKGRHVTAVTNKQVAELGITVTPQHPERELRAAGALFENATAVRDFFADRMVTDGRLVTGQNQNAGTEVAEEMMRIAGGKK
jgi:putative intracellular protease/amidase